MNDDEVLFHIAERYSPEDILDILGLTNELEEEEIAEMDSGAVVKFYKLRILRNLEDFGV